MCGIIGEYSNNTNNLDDFIGKKKLLEHRGPDAQGIFVSGNKKLKFGHQRLAIMDLSEQANQPMIIDDYVIVYNGEIYNFKKLQLEHNLICKTSSDTEVILRLFIKLGVEAFVLLDGMFAIAIFDKNKNQIILARDRMGIKPFYYYHNDNNFLFASEIQALGLSKQMNVNALLKYIQQNYIYGEETILSDVYQLPAASYAIYDLGNKNLKITKYWQADFSIKYNNLDKAQATVHNVLRESVKQSMIADVPLGIFLSSGIDSSLITALAREQSNRLDTFTIGFEFASFDEAKTASAIAKILGTNHHSIYLNKSEVLAAIPHILDQFHQPFGDNSAIPVYFMAKFARQKVKVCLSGDGADELFAGYPMYYLPNIASFYRALPAKSLIKKIVNLLPSQSSKLSLDYKLKRFIYAAQFPLTKAHFYYRIMHNSGILSSVFQEQIQDDFSEYFTAIKDQETLNQLLYIDQQTVLPGDYLVKVDRMSMAHGLEVRLPYLNNQVIAIANALSPHLKLKGMTTKFILKKILAGYLPSNLIYKPKKGFNFPIAAWLRLELKDFMLDTLSKKNVDPLGFLNYDAIQIMIKDHLYQHKDYNRELWGLISLVRYCNKHQINL